MAHSFLVRKNNLQSLLLLFYFPTPVLLVDDSHLLGSWWPSIIWKLQSNVNKYKENLEGHIIPVQLEVVFIRKLSCFVKIVLLIIKKINNMIKYYLDNLGDMDCLATLSNGKKLSHRKMLSGL